MSYDLMMLAAFADAAPCTILTSNGETMVPRVIRLQAGACPEVVA
jgi:hypothetical protein